MSYVRRVCKKVEKTLCGLGEERRKYEYARWYCKYEERIMRCTVILKSHHILD